MDRFNPGRLGDWVVFCDICGQRVNGSESTILSNYTGRGGTVVCTHDVDRIDYGLVPHIIRKEKLVPYIRSVNNNIDNASPLLDLETMSYQWYLANSQDTAIIVSSQDDAWIISTEPI